jgi:hypothetical protein
MFDLEYNMHLYQQCTAKKTATIHRLMFQRDKTRNAIRGLNRSSVIQREGLPKIAFITEIEYTYI